MTDFNTEIEICDDGAFTLFRTRWKTFAARDAEGKGLCSGLDKESVKFWAREHLNGFQNSTVTVTNVSVTPDSLK